MSFYYSFKLSNDEKSLHRKIRRRRRLKHLEEVERHVTGPYTDGKGNSYVWVTSKFIPLQEFEVSERTDDKYTEYNAGVQWWLPYFYSFMIVDNEDRVNELVQSHVENHHVEELSREISTPFQSTIDGKFYVWVTCKFQKIRE